jgi:GMP synthase-like glutamine amidotransferase
MTKIGKNENRNEQNDFGSISESHQDSRAQLPQQFTELLQNCAESATMEVIKKQPRNMTSNVYDN